MDELSQNSQELANANTINESNAISPIQIENTEISNVIEDIETHQVPMVEEPLEEEVDENQIIVLTEEEEKKISSYSREELVEKLEYFLQEKELKEIFWKSYNNKGRALRYQFECAIREGNADLVTIETYQGKY
ncbi:MAG: hypothetical protein RSC04_05735, partial [Bacteroidales bacterium]